ncbi:exosporium glycoprotein BclB-related protein [Lysinibacillus piscis]|uniref:BclB domain-containing protein n=1 Tax=Lysinibacillus piscis TaxID=2518931 RepID=A0ABQ5NMD4_9BACI|nr:exosporium glycoprotein BclB-related protein [Lysinibacillus sp. KH24]GLC89518.1 hypothetical protein LYSBPC_26450 [Lysinibacillus sp. KH24]
MCLNNSSCGCSSNGNNGCSSLGPFVAIDAACITPPSVSATGSIIPFASGPVPAVLATLATGLVGTVSLIGFGSAVPGVSLVGTDIDLSAVVGTEAFSVPRNGNITAISATFSATVAAALLGTTTVHAQVYRAPAGSNIFSPTTASIDLAPAFTTIAIGSTASATANVAPVPVVAGDRLLMVFSITATGITVANVLTGNASAGITIA